MTLSEPVVLCLVRGGEGGPIEWWDMGGCVDRAQAWMLGWMMKIGVDG